MDGKRGEMKQDYKLYYAEQLENALEYQDFIAEHLYSIGLPLFNYASKKYQIQKGENKLGVEIKFDKKMATTGNIWIELSEKSNPTRLNYVDSGINRNDNQWIFVIGDKIKAFVFTKRMLSFLAKKYEHRENNTKTSIGFLLPVAHAEKYAAKILNFEGER